MKYLTNFSTSIDASKAFYVTVAKELRISILAFGLCTPYLVDQKSEA